MCVCFFVHLFCFKYFCNFGWIFIKCASVTYAPVIILNLSLHVLNNIASFFLLCRSKRSRKRKGKYAAHQMFKWSQQQWPYLWTTLCKKKNIEYLFILRHILKRWEALWTISKIPNIIKVCVFDWMLLFSNRTESARSHTHTYTKLCLNHDIPTSFWSSFTFCLNVFNSAFLRCPIFDLLSIWIFVAHFQYKNQICYCYHQTISNYVWIEPFSRQHFILYTIEIVKKNTIREIK